MLTYLHISFLRQT